MHSSHVQLSMSLNILLKNGLDNKSIYEGKMLLFLCYRSCRINSVLSKGILQVFNITIKNHVLRVFNNLGKCS